MRSCKVEPWVEKIMSQLRGGNPDLYPRPGEPNRQNQQEPESSSSFGRMGGGPHQRGGGGIVSLKGEVRSL